MTGKYIKRERKRETLPVTIVEEHLFDEAEDCQLKQHPVEGGQLQSKVTVAIHHHPVHDETEGNGTHDLIDDHRQQGVHQFAPVDLPQKCDRNVTVAMFVRTVVLQIVLRLIGNLCVKLYVNLNKL